MSLCANSVSDELSVCSRSRSGYERKLSRQASWLAHHQHPSVRANKVHAASSFARTRRVQAANSHFYQHLHDCHMCGRGRKPGLPHGQLSERFITVTRGISFLFLLLSYFLKENSTFFQSLLPLNWLFFLSLFFLENECYRVLDGQKVAQTHNKVLQYKSYQLLKPNITRETAWSRHCLRHV